MIIKIAFGGGCHWCTEAVFMSLKGVVNVEQGYVASIGENNAFSEAVIVHYDASRIRLPILVEIHLHTHKSTSQHSMRDKYRSAIYCYSKDQEREARDIMENLQNDFHEPLVTKIYSFNAFKPSREAIANYYYKDPEKPFCKTFINPKLKMLMTKFSKHVIADKLSDNVSIQKEM